MFGERARESKGNLTGRKSREIKGKGHEAGGRDNCLEADSGDVRFIFRNLMVQSYRNGNDRW